MEICLENYQENEVIRIYSEAILSNPMSYCVKTSLLWIKHYSPSTDVRKEQEPLCHAKPSLSLLEVLMVVEDQDAVHSLDEKQNMWIKSL